LEGVEGGLWVAFRVTWTTCRPEGNRWGWRLALWVCNAAPAILPPPLPLFYIQSGRKGGRGRGDRPRPISIKPHIGGYGGLLRGLLLEGLS
jgi:hypothetical protein